MSENGNPRTECRNMMKRRRAQTWTVRGIEHVFSCSALPSEIKLNDSRFQLNRRGDCRKGEKVLQIYWETEEMQSGENGLQGKPVEETVWLIPHSLSYISLKIEWAVEDSDPHFKRMATHFDIRTYYLEQKFYGGLGFFSIAKIYIKKVDRFKT